MAYRVDVFGNNHMKHFFETEDLARDYAKTASKYGIVFLLKETVISGVYDVVELIEEQGV